MPARAAIRLTTRCDNACRFCGQHGTWAGDADDWQAQLVAARSAGADEVTFTGGEPTLCATLEPAIAAARSLGFAAIGVQSHGRALADADVVGRLRTAGLTDVHLSIHGARAVVHDYHVGWPGAFDSVLAAIKHLQASHLTVVVTTVLTRSNARVIAELGPWLAARQVAAWCVAVPHVAGRAAIEFDRIVPRLGLALPFALHALDTARRLGVEVAITGAPGCLLGPWLGAAMAGVARSFAPVCEHCAARARCSGVDATYLARFGGDELHARDALDPASVSPTLAAPALRRMFVGAGELIPVPVSPHPSAAEARRRLPLLERPAPGRDETRRQPQSAEVLFPALRDDDES